MKNKLISAWRLALPSRGEHYTDIHSFMCRIAFHGMYATDRFSIFNRYSPIDIYELNEKFPTAEGLKTTNIGDLIEDRARELANSTDKRIAVLWSGGVDSTSVVIAFIHALQEINQLNRLVIVTSLESFEETETLLKVFQKYPEITIIQKTVFEYYSTIKSISDCLIVSGWCADQLFGSYTNTAYPMFYNDPWTLGVKKILLIENFNTEVLNRYLESMEKVEKIIKEKLPLKIEQFCQFVWWLNFAFKWTFVKDNFILEYKDFSLANSYVCFFDSEQFQKWAMWHYPELEKHNPVLEPYWYKRPMKEYIYEFIGDKEYRDTKGKVSSWNVYYDNDIEQGSLAVKDNEGFKLYPLGDLNYEESFEIIKKYYMREGESA